MTGRLRGRLALAAGILVLSAPLHAGNEATVADWRGHGGASNETAYSALDQIGAANVGQLGLVSWLDLPDEHMLEATPLAIGGILYFTGSHDAVYAVAGPTGKLLWKYDPEVWKHDPDKLHYVLPANRGVAYADGRVFVGTLDGRLIALDARNGREIWSVATTAPGSMQTITGAPRTFDGKVIIGNGGADFGARGYLAAYDQATGKQVWRFYTAPGSSEQNRGDVAMEAAAKTWNGAWWKTGTGGGPWDSITFDAKLNRIYVGTGNASPYDPEQRSPGGGDNLYTASIVALDAESGKYLWHYQVNPRDGWDFDDTQQLILADLKVDGRDRQVLMQAPKNGFFYVIDRLTGELISAGKYGKATWADHIDLATGRPVEAPNIRYQHGGVTIWPAPVGAHNWQTMSFSPKTGLVYIPTLHLGMSYAKLRGENGSLGGLSMAMVERDPQDGKGALVAYDPVRQQARWTVGQRYFWNGGTLATAGGLVFEGAADGWFTAYAADSGKALWRFNAGLGIISAPISYTVDGRQYISVLVGYGGSNSIGDLMNAGWKYGAQPRRLLTFALGGHAALPPSAPPDMAVHPRDDPAVRIAADEVAAGRVLFTMHCAACHGLNAASAGAPAPDLRESAIALSRDSMWTVLHDGVLLPRGMPRFEKLDAVQAGQIYSYIRQMAREVLVPGGSKTRPQPATASVPGRSM